jgi:hypothetical protein
MVVSNKKLEFKCPYSGMELRRPCEVSSCNYNLVDNIKTKPYNRCFLNYAELIRNRPQAAKNEHDFHAFTPDKKMKVASEFFGLSISEVQAINSDFYVSLFSIFAEDAIVDLKKHQLDPVLYRQCAVCGNEADGSLLYPDSLLPPGVGYCSYPCFQLKPPPILLIVRNLDLDFVDFIKSMEYESSQSRSKFVRQLVEWVLGNTPMTLKRVAAA